MVADSELRDARAQLAPVQCWGRGHSSLGVSGNLFRVCSGCSSLQMSSHTCCTCTWKTPIRRQLLSVEFARAWVMSLRAGGGRKTVNLRSVPCVNSGVSVHVTRTGECSIAVRAFMILLLSDTLFLLRRCVPFATVRI